MYLDEIEIKNIDSAKTVDGKFKITHKWDESEPKWIRINHVDKKGVKRLFSFTTNAKYRNVAGWATTVFYSDSIIVINGNLREKPPNPEFILPKNMIEVRGPKLVTGKQTEAYHNIDGDLFEEIDDNTIQTIEEKLKKYPTSYHLLSIITQNKNDFSAQQVEEFLKSFKGEITNSESYKKLSAYNKKRFNADANPLAQTENINSKKSDILDKKFDKHLIIFWASWCGPCREEIPMLKKIYSSKNPNTEFISISIDDDKDA